ncbi:MAG: hypothetical protein PHG05_02155 [Candidatus Nanoarchaeia archaeon]|nr:hypothetical protein [Candidatus Nanoarchaeia archaeon]
MDVVKEQNIREKVEVYFKKKSEDDLFEIHLILAKEIPSLVKQLPFLKLPRLPINPEYGEDPEGLREKVVQAHIQILKAIQELPGPAIPSVTRQLSKKPLRYFLKLL